MKVRDPLRDEWAAQIRFTRAHHKLTQAKFARLLGVTDQTVSDWELSKRFPAAEHRATLMKMFAEAEQAQLADEDGAAV